MAGGKANLQVGGTRDPKSATSGLQSQRFPSSGMAAKVQPRLGDSKGPAWELREPCGCYLSKDLWRGDNILKGVPKHYAAVRQLIRPEGRADRIRQFVLADLAYRSLRRAG